MRMVNKTMSDQALLNKEPYRSIINLFNAMKYGDELTHGHILYALGKGEPAIYTNKKRYRKIDDREEIKHFFETYDFGYKLVVLGNKINRRKKRFEDFFHDGKRRLKTGEISQPTLVRGCIKRPQHLNDSLRHLINRCWLQIQPGGKPKYYRYSLSSGFFIDKMKRDIIYLLHTWKSDYVLTEGMIGMRDFSDQRKFLLCGFPIELMEILSEKEKQDLNGWIQSIDETLKKVASLKNEKLKISSSKHLGMDINEQINMNYLGFCYYLRVEND